MGSHCTEDELKGKQSHLSLHSDSVPVFHHILKPVGASLALAVGVYRSTAWVFGQGTWPLIAGVVAMNPGVGNILGCRSRTGQRWLSKVWL